MKRRGVSLVELVAVLPLLAVASVMFTALLSTLIREVPKQQKVTQIAAGISSMLHRLDRDVNAARSLPDRHAGISAGEELLLIELPQGVVCYRPIGGALVRSDLSTGGTISTTQPAEKASTPRASVRFRRWRRDGQVYAVEVRTAVQYSVKGRSLEKLINSHVLFPASLGGRQETQ